MADGRVVIAVDWDDSEVSKGIKSTQKEIEKNLDNVEIKADIKTDDSGIQELQKQLDKIDDVSINADVNIDDSGIDKLQRQLSDTTVNFEVKTISDLDDVLKQINKLEGETAKINITASGDELDEVLRQVRQLDGENINIDINVDDSQLDETEKKISGFGTVGAIAGIVGIATVTQEYNEDVAKLATNTELAGESFENAEEQLKNLNAITGETDSNVEALSNLMQAGFKGDTLANVVEDLSGAVIKFPDTLKIEGLADGLQETLATGKAIGPFAELLERMGVDLETFDAGLASAAESGDELNYIMGTFDELDLSGVTEQYREQNAAIVESKDAQFELNAALAEIGTTITPLITPLVEAFANLLNFLLENKEVVGAFVAVLGGALVAIKAMAIISTILPMFTALIGVIKGTTTVTAALNAVFALSPIGLIVIAVAALVAGFIYLWNTSEDFRNFWIKLWEAVMLITETVINAVVGFFTETIPNAFSGFMDFFKNIFVTDWSTQFGVLGELMNVYFATFAQIWENIKGVFTGVIDFIKNVFTGNWQGAWQAVQDIFGNVFEGMIALAKYPINAIIALINGLTSGINLAIEGLNSLQIDVPDWVPVIGGGTFGFSIPTIPQIPYLARGGLVNRATQAVIGEAGAEAVIPLEKNTQGIQMIADLIADKIGVSKANEQTIRLVTVDGKTLLEFVVNGINSITETTGETPLVFG